MSKDLMMTTVDHPYNPFEEFYEWLSFDIAKGYNTCGLVARLCITSDELSEADQDLDLEEAWRAVLRVNPLLYRLVDSTNAPQTVDDVEE